MTEINLEVKMHWVDGLFAGASFRTEVWISETASKTLVTHVRKSNEGKEFVKKLKRYAERGFASFEFAKGPIRHEGNGVYRIGDRGSLFRLIGFYENRHAMFIVIDAFQKRGQELSSAERGRIAEVARVRDRNRWARRTENEQGNPRDP